MRRLHFVSILSALVACLALAAPSPARATTLTPSLTAPVNGSTVGSSFTVTYTLPEAPAAGTVKLIFDHGVTTCTVTMSEATSVSFTMQVNNVLESSAEVAASNCATLPNGSTSVKVRYQNAALDPAAESTPVTITIDTQTAAPTFLTEDDSRYGRTVLFNYFLPESPSAVSIVLTDGDATCTLTMSTSFTTVNTTVDLFSATDNPKVTAASTACATLAGGTYTVTLSYQDLLANPAATKSATGVVLDFVTGTPTLVKPIASTTYTTSFPLELSRPESATAGSFTLTFDGDTDYVLTLDDATDSFDTDIPVAAPTDNPAVVSMSPTGGIADGTYTVTASYQDDLGNPAAAASHALVTIDRVTATPSLTAPASSSTYSLAVPLDYSLPETVTAGSVSVTFLGTDTCTLTMADQQTVSTSISVSDPGSNEFVVSSDCVTIPLDTYTVRVAYRDVSGNPVATIDATNVRLASRPAAPTVSAVVPGNGRVAVSWTAPADGGAPITDYVLRVRRASSATWTQVPGTVSTATTATLTGLTNGTRYVVQVAAINTVGTGAWSPSSAVATPRTRPSAPAAPTARMKRGKVVVSWAAPANGGAPITDYVVQYRKGTGSWKTAPDGVSTRTTATVGLPGGRYTFRVAAVNAVGRSSVSAASTHLTVPR